jgi:hypothetical protein
MIVRIAGEEQFRLEGGAVAEVERLDRELLEAVERGEEARFQETLQRLLSLVREQGSPLGEDELAASDLILPPPDTTLAEAREDFSGEGWLPEG